MFKRIVTLTIITISLFAQLSYDFEHTSHIKDFEQIKGSAWDIDISPNGTIFVANMDGGILVYNFDGFELSKISQTIDGDPRVINISAMNDSLILISDYKGKLISYEYDGDTLIHKAEITVETPGRIMVVNDTTIFLSCEQNGLKVFHFDGIRFTLKTTIDDVDWVYDSIMLNDSTMLLGAGGTLSTYLYQDTTFSLITQIERIGSEQYFIDAKALYLKDDGTIFCANNSNGLLAFTYEDSVFSLIAKKNTPFLSMYEMEGFNDVEVKENIIYIAGVSGGVYAYEYTGNSFLLLDNRDEVYYGCFNVKVVENTVFVATGSSSLWVYGFNGSAFSVLDRIICDGNTQRLAYDENGTIYSANGTDGLRVYQIIDNEFVHIAHLNDSRYVLDVAVSPDGSMIFLANKRDGIGVYSFNGSDFTLMDRFRPEESEYYYYSTNDINSVELIEENKVLYIQKVNMSDYNSGKSYSFGIAKTCTWNGSSLVNMSYVYSYPMDGYQYVSGLVSDVAFVNEDSVVAGLGNVGIATEYGNEISTGGYVRDVDILPDGTILTANSTAGLKIYEYNTGFMIQDSINNGGSATNVLRFQDGTLLLANGDDGLRSYVYDNEFICTAHIDNGGTAKDVIVLPDSTIILANGEDGLRAYRYNGFIPDTSGNSGDNPGEDPDDYPQDDPEIPATFKLYQNYPNPFNPSTTIQYYMRKKANAYIRIYDASGKKIKEWYFENSGQGFHSIIWDGKNEDNKFVPNGVYICQIAVKYYDLFLESKKMILLK